MRSSTSIAVLFFSFTIHLLSFLTHAQAITDRPSQAPPSTFPSGTESLSATGSATGSASISASASTSTTLSASAFPPLNTVSPCVSQCLQVAVGATNCGSLTDVNCFCNRSNYTSVLVDCISGTCPTELNTAETLAQQFCNLANSSSSLSFPTLTTPTTSPASSSTPTSPPVTGSSSSSSPSSTETVPATTSGAGNFAGSLGQEAKKGSLVATALLSVSGLLLGILTVV